MILLFRPRGALVVLGAAVLLLAACGSSNKNSSTGTTTTVAQSSGPSARVDTVPEGGSWAFKPDTLTVAPATRITWTNRSNVPHNVVFDDKSVPSSDLFSENKTYSVTISQPGTYTYICSIHPNMTGKVIVQ